jgi:membrane protease subunit (stomatin/prohibitin family)
MDISTNTIGLHNLYTTTPLNSGKNDPQVGSFLPYSLNESTIKISELGNQFGNMDRLNSELNDIFGIGKILSPAELKQELKINNEIDKIFGSIKLSKTDQAISDKITKQVDAIFADDIVTADEEKTLASLDERLSKLYENNTSLSKEDEEKLDDLFNQLDTLYGFNDLDSNFSSLLTPTELKQEQQINNEIDKILGSIKLSKKEQTLSDKITKQIDAIFADDIVTADEEKTLASLGERLSKLYENNTSLSKEDEEKLDDLFNQLDTLYGFNDLDKDILLNVESIFSQLDKINKIIDLEYSSHLGENTYNSKGA